MIKTISVLICLLLTSCSEPTNSPALRLGTNIWPGYEPLYLARELGYLESNKVRLIEYTSTSQVIKAYRNGLLDAAAVTLDEAISLLATGEQTKLVLVMDISNGADVLIGQANLKHVSDIKGKRVGVEHTALGAYFINRVLEKNGLSINEITVVPLTVNQHERAFRNKEVDAVLTFDPVSSKLLNSGANNLFDSSEIPGEIVDVLIVNADKIIDFDEQIKHLKEGWFHALDDMNAKSFKTTKILGVRMQLSNEDVLKVYEGLVLPSMSMNESLLYNNQNPNLLKSARKLSNIMYENKLISSVVDTKDLFIKK